jgi:hypothetical protein
MLVVMEDWAGSGLTRERSRSRVRAELAQQPLAAAIGAIMIGIFHFLTLLSKKTPVVCSLPHHWRSPHQTRGTGSLSYRKSYHVLDSDHPTPGPFAIHPPTKYK